MMKNILLSAAAASILLGASVGASANTTVCKLSARFCKPVTVSAPAIASVCTPRDVRFCRPVN